MNNKSDVVAGARGVGGGVGRGAGSSGWVWGEGVVERRVLWGKRHGSYTKQEL